MFRLGDYIYIKHLVRSDVHKKVETLEQYVKTVLAFYLKYTFKVGILKFDSNLQRFVVLNNKNKIVSELHCGDIYLVEQDNQWYVGQCERYAHKWRMLGTNVTEDSPQVFKVLYSDTKELHRWDTNEPWLDDQWLFGPLPDIITANLKTK